MNFNLIPLFYKPSTIVAVADDPNYLDNLNLYVSDEIQCQTFDNPRMALSFINANTILQNFERRYIRFSEETTEEYSSVQLNIKNIHQEIYNEKRFDEITVTISDFVMSMMNGIELCRQITNSRIQKLLLTGQAGTDLAVKAFNDNIINKFILKNIDELDKNLLKEIKQLQNNYFENYTKSVLTTFSFSNLLILSNPDFIKLFNSLFNLYHIVEFYILDSYGSFLLLDEMAKPIWLVLRKKQDIIEKADFVADFKVSKQILTDLSDCKKIPFFYSEKDFNISPEHWEPYMHPAHELNTEYVYAIIEDSSLYSLQKENILSYHDFLY